ncbi:receptor-like protein kinase FERONIA [Dorcoceras hygrometricum]|uniref:Receptor-like protein kinase FERONIA n=1 Tax=Dorcoceras hygrometricum TaxID=472368 RepID=A0A2Z7CQF0_9LAMI|nr:receptor-like protein kinase FERONIA [Dorcoceras hygrometricum]
MNPLSIILTPFTICFFTAITIAVHDHEYLMADVSLNCGSTENFAATDGQEWIGDGHQKISSSIQIKGLSTSSSIASGSLVSADQTQYKTARISRSRFLYAFHLNSGPKFIRLHFNPVPYRGFSRFYDLFTVEAGPFILLRNFSASLTSDALGGNEKSFAKEFSVNIEETQRFDIIFYPYQSIQSGNGAYAFINGIEIISIPAHLSYFHSGVQVVGLSYPAHICNYNHSALQIIHRENVKPNDDLVNMFRSRTTIPRSETNKLDYVTWNVAVDLGFRYMVRIHFRELGPEIEREAHLIFEILINGIRIESTLVKKGNDNEFQQYKDYVTIIQGRKQDGKHNLLISIESTNELLKNRHFKGFEILKLSNFDNSLASPNPQPRARGLQVLTIKKLLTVCGGRNIIATAALTVIALVNIVVYKLRQLLEDNFKEDGEKPSARARQLCRRFSLAEIEAATKNFNDSFVIGKGGFGKVYKGIIDNGQEIVAIKRLKYSSNQGEREFWREVETLSELRHVNLVSLIGYCNEQEELILIYEYMIHGTLGDHLYKLPMGNSCSSSLSWNQRLSICIGAGRGIDYLHTGHRIIHRDVKTSNILLDENFVAKISDFGLAKPEVMSESQSYVSTNIKGTYGYFDPYYIRTKNVTTKSDIYAFGVVLLEVLCGRPAINPRVGEDQHSLAMWAQENISKGAVEKIISSDIKREILPRSLKEFVSVTKSCLDDEPTKRPTMAQVVLQLEFVLDLQKKPNSLLSKETSTANHSPWDVFFKSAKSFTRNESVESTSGRNELLNERWDSLAENYATEVKVSEFDWVTIQAATNLFSDSCIIGKGRGERRGQLPWRLYFNLIIGIARGVCCLHQNPDFRRVYCNLEPCNIFLDTDMNPKIAIDYCKTNTKFSQRYSSWWGECFIYLCEYFVGRACPPMWFNWQANYMNPRSKQYSRDNNYWKFHRYKKILPPFIIGFFTIITAAIHDHEYLKGDVLINCGSTENYAADDGREWIGDRYEKESASVNIKGSSRSSSVASGSILSADQAQYKTARISRSQFSYTFHLSPGPKFIRLHFNPVIYRGFEGYNDLFTVEAGPFTLLGNFSASLTVDALGGNGRSFAKEFCINIEENQRLEIVFYPDQSIRSQDGTYAFINGIEIISIPMHLSYFRSGVQVVGLKSLAHVYNHDHTALEIIHRQNVKSSDDLTSMFRVRTAIPEHNRNKLNNITWKIAVDVGFRYLVRIHYCELGVKNAKEAQVISKIFINQIGVDYDIQWTEKMDNNEFLQYRDYMTTIQGRKQDGKHNLLISIESTDELMDRNGPFKGFEILKLSNLDNSLASPNPQPPARSLPYPTIQKLLKACGARNIIATASVTIVTVVNIVVYILQQLWDDNLKKEEKELSARARRLCRRFSLAEIEAATQKFNHTFVIGKGGFGKVYKGIIDNGHETVAIKRLKYSSNQGEREFWTEIETLSELRHVNLVSLIGYCNEQQEMILVYEYMINGTLGDHLFKQAISDNQSVLSWNQCLNICIGAGRGLDYLHTGHGIIHRDVKTSNILLDKNFIAKVSDFGLAKPENICESQSHVSTNVRGTHGYFDPHYIRTRELTRKSDIYAFGVVLLEVLCWRPALDPRLEEAQRSLATWARENISKGDTEKIISSNIKGEILPDSLRAFVRVAESCLNDEPMKRPSMAQVVLQLESALDQQEKPKSLFFKETSSDSESEWEPAKPSNHMDLEESTSGRRMSELEFYHLSKYKHPNIMKLLGNFIHGEEMLLVYEFTQNTSLDEIVYGRLDQLPRTLYSKLILGIARGVCCLHQSPDLRTIYCNIEPCNIFLDIDMNPKIAFDCCKTKLNTITSTRDYAPPEGYQVNQVYASDIYSFGVIVLEILSGCKHSCSNQQMNLITLAWNLWSEGRGLDLLGTWNGPHFSTEQAETCIQIALLCTQFQPQHRPEMSLVVRALLGVLDLRAYMREAEKRV